MLKNTDHLITIDGPNMLQSNLVASKNKHFIYLEDRDVKFPACMIEKKTEQITNGVLPPTTEK